MSHDVALAGVFAICARLQMKNVFGTGDIRVVCRNMIEAIPSEHPLSDRFRTDIVEFEKQFGETGEQANGDIMPASPQQVGEYQHE